MSISYKKINSMITDVVNIVSDVDDEKKEVLREVCEKVYMIESSIENTSSHQMISEIKGEISRRSNKF